MNRFMDKFMALIKKINKFVSAASPAKIKIGAAKKEEPSAPEIVAEEPWVSSSDMKSGFTLGESMAGAKILRQIGKVMIYLLVFLIPLFFLPWTSNILDFNKQALLLILVFLSSVAWLTSNLVSNKFEVNTSFFNVPVAVLLLVSLISVIFSVFRYGSFWGLPLSVSSSFLSLLGFIILYFLIANLFEKDEIVYVFLTLFLSGFLASLFGIFQLFGKFILPLDFTKITSFNTVGTANGLALFDSLLLLIVLPFLFFAKKLFKIILGIFIVVLLVSLLIINFKAAWLVLLAGTIVLFNFGVVNLRKIGKSNFITGVMIFLVIALFFTFYRSPLPGAPPAPLEVSPAQKTEFTILKQLPLKSLFLGSGPSTFIYDWSKYKPLALNQTVFWSTRFNKGASEILDSAITTGIIGVLGLFFLIFVFFQKAFRYLFKKLKDNATKTKISDGASWFLPLGMIASLVGLVVGLFLYPASFSILLIFWLLIGTVALLEADRTKTIILDTSPTKALSFSFVFVLILVLEIGFSIIYFQKYTAEVRYSEGLKAFQAGKTVIAINSLSQAISLNPQIDVYQRDLSQVQLMRLNDILSATNLTQESKSSQAQELVMSVVNSATQATLLNPADVADWNVRGFIYSNLIGILDGADEWAIKSYEEAAKREPTSPYVPTEIGRIYLAKANLAAQGGDSSGRRDNIKSAQTYFEKAISLKADYAPANYQIAAIYIDQGKTSEAINNLEVAKQGAQSDIGLAFQLAVIYYSENQFDKAKAEFERAVALDPSYSNARYFLGLIYDQAGYKASAISQFEEIEKYNPENQEVKQILSNLRKGKAALEGIVPSRPPIQESAPENLKK